MVSRRYGDVSTYWNELANETAILNHLIARTGLTPAAFVKHDLAETLAALRADDQAAAAVALADDPEGRNLALEVRTLLNQRLPRFQYFDDYNILPGRVSITRLQTVD